MEHVWSVDHAQQLIGQVKKAHPALCSNCYLLPDELSRLCRDRALCYAVCPAGLLLYQRRAWDVKLHFFLNPELPLTVERGDTPVTVDLLYAGSELPVAMRAAVTELTRCGFVSNGHMRRMSMRMTPERQASLNADVGSIPVIPAQRAQVDAVLSLWENTFDRYGSALPGREELCRRMDAQQIHVVLETTGALAGTIQMEFTRGLGTLSHLAVVADRRGRGVGKALLRRYLAMGGEKGVARHQLWVSDHEQEAHQYYLPYGYAFDGRQAVQYLLK